MVISQYWKDDIYTSHISTSRIATFFSACCMTSAKYITVAFLSLVGLVVLLYILLVAFTTGFLMHYFSSSSEKSHCTDMFLTWKIILLYTHACTSEWCLAVLYLHALYPSSYLCSFPVVQILN